MTKMLMKEVKTTDLKITKVRLDEKSGNPIFDRVKEVTLIGNLTQDKAITEIHNRIGAGYTILSMKHQSHKYSMLLEDFIQMAICRTNVKVENEEKTK